MTRRRRPVAADVGGSTAAAALAVLVIAVGFLIAFWKALLITCAILALPFAIWWLRDRELRHYPQHEETVQPSARSVAGSRGSLLGRVTRRTEEARQRFWERAAREVEKRRG